MVNATSRTRAARVAGLLALLASTASAFHSPARALGGGRLARRPRAPAAAARRDEGLRPGSRRRCVPRASTELVEGVSGLSGLWPAYLGQCHALFSHACPPGEWGGSSPVHQRTSRQEPRHALI